MKIKFTDVEEYLSVFPEEIIELLQTLRTAIKEAAPEAEEVISYNMPAYRYHGILVYFAAYKNHIGFYPGSSLINEVFKKDLVKYKTSKGTIQFPLDQQLPIKLIQKIVRFRVMYNLDKTKAKKRR
ncbi:MAG: DUF1801 domain-containing protein [Melioribacter sp.]|nr:DUF1801 domain-containing protein [Melioribacter sp.]